jgi:Immunoglobulin I-set domain
MKRICIIPVTWLGLGLVTSTVLSQSATLLYTNDFERAAGAEWSKGPISTTPKGSRRFLGQFGSEWVSVFLAGLPSHDMITVGFDLYVIRSWDGSQSDQNGPDIFQIQEGQTNVVFRTTFATHEYYESDTNGTHLVSRKQAYPGRFPEDEFPWSTGCREADTLGYSWNWPLSVTPRYNADCVYHIVKSFPHSADVLRLSFAKISPPGNGVDEESWGLDNVSITATAGLEGQGPVIIGEPESVDLSEDGDGTAFTVSALSLEPMTYQWYHGGRPLADATNSFCVITNFEADALGDYQVLVANANGIALSDAATFSVEAPSIRDSPTNNVLTVGAESAVFSVRAVGPGKLSYQWFHDGTALSDGSRVDGANAPTLTIGSGVRESDEGEYRVVVENFAGMTNGASATLTVALPPAPAVSLLLAVKPVFSSLTVGVGYQLQISSDTGTWTNQGVPFTATSTSMVYPQYWDVDDWARLFFRLQVVP